MNGYINISTDMAYAKQTSVTAEGRKKEEKKKHSNLSEQSANNGEGREA